MEGRSIGDGRIGDGRIIGLDVGDARTGIAVSDELGMVATALDTLHVTSPEADAEAIRNIVEEQEAVRVVVGLPLNQDGEVGPQAEKVLRFVEVLGGILDVEIETQDERFSTVLAKQRLNEANVKGRKKRGMIDKVAAQQILQLYLDREASRRRREQT